MILTINPGSSSIKSTLFDTYGQIVGSIQIDHSGVNPQLCHLDQRETLCREDLTHSVSTLLEAYKAQNILVSFSQISAIGVRVVHGGKHFFGTTRINHTTIEQLEEVTRLAPLHNPPALRILREILSIKKAPALYACFDTAFHHTIPEHIAEYALPRAFETQYGIKKYGFHGLSCASIVDQVHSLYAGNIPEKMIICHLGSGSSITALRHGKSYDTSMGLTPLEGIIMRTRGGDIDPGAILEMLRHAPSSYSREEAIAHVETILNYESGLKALSGGINDLRIIIEQATQGNEFCKNAITSYVYHIQKYIGAYCAILGGCDCLVFTAGTGEASSYIRTLILTPLQALGFQLDEEKNTENAINSNIAAPHSPCDILVMHTDENKQIWKEVMAFVK